VGLFKAECIRTTIFHDGPYQSIADIEFATMGWVDWSLYAGDPWPTGRVGMERSPHRSEIYGEVHPVPAAHLPAWRR
jgi:hypothetical protein